jgi:hypothetical protein
MMLKLAVRSLLAHPLRSAVLACGFGLGVSVMATLLGVGEVILAQARAPALTGGGDVIVAGAAGRVFSARYVLSSVLGTSPLKERMAAASPTTRATLYLVGPGGRVVPIRAKGGIPSLERGLGDPETGGTAAWADTAADAAWASPDPGDVLRSMDRFHPVPDVPARAASWAEWLYFNGRAGDTQLYLTFLVGPRKRGGLRAAGVRLQLDRGGRRSSYGAGQEIEEETLLAAAPDLEIGPCRIRLEGLRYRVSVDLPREGPGIGSAGGPARVSGELTVQALPGRSLPPLTIRGAGGWVSGYVVPVMSGTLGGSLQVAGERIGLDGGAAYHDHNWGFWTGVTWQWGQVQHGEMSFLYGRVRPPADAAEPGRVPGFLAALGPGGPVGYSADVSIQETSDPGTGRPRQIVVQGRGPSLDLKMELGVEDATVTRMGPNVFGGGMDFFQVRASYRVTGVAGGRRVDFEATGSAETFRGR